MAHLQTQKTTLDKTDELLRSLAPIECFPKIQCDRKAIAQGIYNMTMELDDYKDALAFGMLPAPLMEMMERNLKDKLLESCCALFGWKPTKENLGLLNLNKKKYNDLVHDISLEIYHIAKESGLMIV